MRFMRFVRECGLEGYVTSHEADLLFMQVVMRSGGGMFGEDDSNHKMGFQEFCDALLEMASRKSAREGDGECSVAPRLLELLDALQLPDVSEQSEPAPAAALRKAATAASCVAKVRRATHDGNRLSVRLSPPP
eukprot:CAMPEP_0118820282 /NCGR_PEP_ID=MMETSP1162-20130426/7596_1 /TAXON_ID=33656 /ORGANISM="Phaeocystis Sp, Strain CCMP2710" /LENGTH=132 /DNA_ID=CAMNT_0006750653 /DNA_START=1 /DNA_END=399 /DNA_ORIENTATION=-